MKRECYPKRQDLTQSAIYAAAWDAQDGANDAIPGATDVDGLESIRDNTAELVDDIANELQEKMDNIESGVGHTGLPIYDELDERRGEYERWSESIEAVEFESFVDWWDSNVNGETCPECQGELKFEVEDDGLGSVKCLAGCFVSADDWRDKVDEWLEEQRQALRDVVDECPE
jgi:hypothetical protein